MERYVNPSGTFTPEENMYLQYIRDHIDRVRKSFDERGPLLQRVLGLTHDEMAKLSTRVSEHDESKYSLDEFPAYRNWFYPAAKEEKDDNAFALAWQHHYKTNDHHPEYWIVNGIPTEMNKVAIAEMILDWEAMSRNFGGNPRTWYESSKKNITLNPKTEALVQNALSILYTRDMNLKEYRNPILG